MLCTGVNDPDRPVRFPVETTVMMYGSVDEAVAISTEKLEEESRLELPSAIR